MDNMVDNYSEIWVSRYVVSEIISRIISKKTIKNKKDKISKIWKQLNDEGINNEGTIGNIDTLSRIYKDAYRITYKHSANNNAPNFIDCYQVALANYLHKKTRSDIDVASFDQYFPKGSYNPVFFP